MSFLPHALTTIGVDAATGAVTRLPWTDADADCRAWFAERALAAGLEVEVDGNGNQWAWWGRELPGTAIVTGSHLDSVPDGGLWDGPLGVVAAFEAVARLRREADAGAGFRPRRPIAVVNFAEEEGGRFGLACWGSRMLVGAADPARALAQADRDGVTLDDAMIAAGFDPETVGPDPVRLAHVGEYIEVHVEQGHLPIEGSGLAGLAAADAPLGVLTEIWAHGRWRVDIHGTPNHAGTTPLAQRDDPVLTMADLILAVRAAAVEQGVIATVGKVAVVPGAVNAIASRASVWIDGRGADPDAVRAVPAAVAAQCGVTAVQESWTPATPFDGELTAGLAAASARVMGHACPALPSGAGHDAGVLAEAGIPAAMLVVRNREGISHAAGEHADDADAWLAVDALVEVLRERAGE